MTLAFGKCTYIITLSLLSVKYAMNRHTYFEKVTSKPHVLWTVIMISIVLLPSRCYFFHNKVKLNARWPIAIVRILLDTLQSVPGLRHKSKTSDCDSFPHSSTSKCVRLIFNRFPLGISKTRGFLQLDRLAAQFHPQSSGAPQRNRGKLQIYQAERSSD